MTSVTQTIPTLTGGLSQQPDELKIPGQVNVANNVIPDVTHGLLKRPGGKLVASLTDNTNTVLNSQILGKWFSYYRDETESYIGQIARNGSIKMWRCSDGQAITVYDQGASLTFNNVNWSTQSGSQNVFQNPIKFTTSSQWQPIYNQINGKVLLGNSSTTGSKVVVTNITNPTGYFVNNVELELVANQSTYGRAGKRDSAGPTSGSGTCTLTITLSNSAYLIHSNDEDLQTLTLNDFTFITNRLKTTAMSSTVETVRPPEVFIDLKATAYARQYAVNLYDTENTQEVRTATRISVDLVKSSNNYCDGNGGMVARNTRKTSTTRCDSTAGDGRDAYAPNVGTRVFDIDDGASLTDEALSGSHTYPIDVKDSGDNSVNRGKNLYFRIRTTGQSVPFTTGSGENQTTTYQARYTTTYDLLYGGEEWSLGDYFYVWMDDGYYKVTIEAVSTTKVQANLGLVRPNPTPFDTETTVTASSILGDIRQGILGNGNYPDGSAVGGTNALYNFKDDPDNGFEVKQIGNGIYVTRPSSQGAFNITAPSSDLLRVMSSEVTTVEDLPSQCKHGYVVKVANSAADEDDYYVKFFGNNDRDGDGVWEECAKPGDNIEFDTGTMPIQLVRRFDDLSGTITGTANAPYFSVEQVAWDNAQVGTTVVGGTNPQPSFIGNAINKLVFFRNRLVMLSEENVIMSRPGDFFNFWSKTATTFTPQDVIDLSCSSEYPATVYDGIQVNAGLLLFTKNQQFMLTTDSDILSPETAKLNAVSSYNFNEKTSPVSLGTTVAFLDNANKFTRFFEMSNVLRQGEPDIVDQSAVISRLLDKDVNIIAESRENSVVFFSKKGTKTIYGFRYFASGERRLLQAWFTWEVVGDVQHLCMLDDALYVVTRGTGNKDQMIKYSLKLDDTGFFVTDTQETTDTDDDVIYKVHLDHMSTVSGATYDSSTKKSTLTKPNGYIYDTTQLVAYDTDAGNDLGRYSLITVSGNNLIIDGDWSSNNFVIGYLYEMDVQIPTLYVTRAEGTKFRSDAKSSLIIHRVKFSFGPLGVYSTTITRVGKPDYTEEFELGLAGFVAANRLPIVEEKIETVPCYERNTNLKVNVKSSHPSPATLYSLAWEGDFTNRFYRRV